MGTKKGRRYFFRIVTPAGNRLPVVSYAWLACGTRLRNVQTCICQLITIGDRFSSFSELEA